MAPVPGSGLRIVPDMPLCQQDLALDSYQDAFRPYAEEYLALPDRLPATVLPWMDGYIHASISRTGQVFTTSDFSIHARRAIATPRGMQAS